MGASDHLHSIGIMTGNSLDGVDVVLTRFGKDGSIVDLDSHGAPMPDQLTKGLRLFRNVVGECSGEMDSAIARYEQEAAKAKVDSPTFDKLVAEYTLYVAGVVKELAKRAISSGSRIDLIGLHGQTCAHLPPSIAKDAKESYTLQIGDGQLLANETGITVVYDFRSDDLMNGGEAAPLAPVHHEHLARHLKKQGKFPIAFCNAGNTGNISVISERPDGSVVALGWDVGPFNNYPDKLMQKEGGKACDEGGAVGRNGKVNLDLLRVLFERGVVTRDGANFLLQQPPKSSDPQWYRLLPELLGEAPVAGKVLSFEDRLRTAEYFSAYVYYYSLKWIPPEVTMPARYALCGGGWNNPLSKEHFEQLLRGDFGNSPVLPEHSELFSEILGRLKAGAGGKVEVAMSDAFGFNGQYMEARIFADAAFCRIIGEPFSVPETTGCRAPTVLGIIRFPQAKQERASEELKQWLADYGSASLTLDEPRAFDGRWSRAARGWQGRAKVTVSR